MSLAIATLSRWFSPLWVGTAPAHRPLAPEAPRFPVHTTPPSPASLRVTRLQEERLPRHLAGRMVISGRLDDVCRELARLEALGQDLTH
ncbi:MAG: hypothetical protein RIT26_1718 [Pseudomonadota bacterium]|jgi:hypothetical protein